MFEVRLNDKQICVCCKAKQAMECLLNNVMELTTSDKLEVISPKGEVIYEYVLGDFPFACCGNFDGFFVEQGNTSQGRCYANEKALFDHKLPLYVPESEFEKYDRLPFDPKRDAVWTYNYYLGYAKECVREYFNNLTEDEIDFYGYMLLFYTIEWAIDEGWCSLETHMNEAVESMEIDHQF